MANDFHEFQLEEVKQAVSSYCSFSLGKQHIMELAPSNNSLYLNRELARLKEMIALVVRYGSLPLGGIRNITTQLNASLMDATLDAQELLSVAQHAYVCQNVVSFINKSSDLSLSEIHELSDSLRVYPDLSAEIQRCINENGEVNDSASPKLKQLRRSLKTCENNLHKTAQEYVRNNSSKLSDTITTSRNDRVVVLVKNSEKNTVNGFIHGESNSGQTIYMEPECLLTLNNERQSIQYQIHEEIHQILTNLSRRVKRHAEDYLRNLYTLELLDSFNARALWAKDYDGCVATIGDTLTLKGARHPLLDQKTVVANSYHIDKDKRMLLISGPNTGGKTVSLKIIGLFTVLTYCGMALSCEEATIPLFDEIFVDIGDEQSILQNLSTFSSHMNRLADICNKVTKNSLVILDEPGNGTDPNEGECLAMAILDHLRAVGCFSAVTTHFSKLKTYGKRYPEIQVASVEFNQEELKPTYRFVEGVTGQSNALEIARRLGLSDSILDRAKQLRVSYRTREEALLEQLEVSLAESRRHEDLLKQKEKELESEQKALQKELNTYQTQKDRLLDTAKKEADEYLQEAQKEADQLLKLLRESQTVHEAIKLKHTLDVKANAEEEEEEAEDHEFKVNDYVSIRNSNQRGVIESLQKNKAVVNVNGLRMTVSLNNLSYLKEKPQQKKEKSHVSVKKPGSMPLELNLIGYRVDEALPILDKYIDDAILLKAPFLRVIHGFGTGALRKGIWTHLKNNPFIEEMRYGGESEGGSGATILTFKKKK